MNRNKIILAAIACTVLVITTMFLLRTSIFNASETDLLKALQTNHVYFENQKHSFNIIPTDNRQTDTGLIFYPGALVDSRAYALKLAGTASSNGLKIFIIKPRLRLSAIDANAADQIIKANPSISKWYIGGHSMGAGAACSYSNHHSSKVAGLVMFAGYCSKSDAAFSGRTLTLVGSQDPLEPASKVQKRVPAISTIIKIEGANHASFGNYGGQPFDGQQTGNVDDITRAITAALGDFIR